MASQKGVGLNPRATKLRYLDRSAEEAGRQKRTQTIPGRLKPKKTVARTIHIDEIEEYEAKQDFGTYYPKRYIKCFSDRNQLDKLGAIYGLLKSFEGKTFDEFYSAFKTGCSQNSTASIHVAQHATEKLHIQIKVVDGVIWGSKNRLFGPYFTQLKKDDYYVDFDGIIRRLDNDNLYPPKVYSERKGFWTDVHIKVNSDPDQCCKKELKFRYIIGPFCTKNISKSELSAFKLEQGFSNNIYVKPGFKGVKSDSPLAKHYCVRIGSSLYWYPRYYIVLDYAKLQTNPYSLYQKRKPQYCSVGTVIFEEDIQYPI
jgi:hypothetical protein